MKKTLLGLLIFCSCSKPQTPQPQTGNTVNTNLKISVSIYPNNKVNVLYAFVVLKPAQSMNGTFTKDTSWIFKTGSGVISGEYSTENHVDSIITKFYVGNVLKGQTNSFYPYFDY